jgi:hypothetical protein
MPHALTREPVLQRPDLVRELTCPDQRAKRVIMLLLAIVLMSLGDLYMTLVHVLGPGLLEGNPLARAVIAHQPPAMLVLFKLGTVALAGYILFHARRSAYGELATWFCFIVLTWLTIRWHVYSDQIHYVAAYLAAAPEADTMWVASPKPSK